MDKELKPCPECGGEAELMEDLLLVWVACTECGLDTGECTDENYAVELWNS